MISTEHYNSISHFHKSFPKPIQTKMESTGQGLDYILDEGGSNLSVGEKQLLCLGKRHLRFYHNAQVF